MTCNGEMWEYATSETFRILYFPGCSQKSIDFGKIRRPGNTACKCM